MTATYVVLSHREPGQVERLVARILALSPDATVLVRHDARTSAAPRAASDRVRVEPHTARSDWGSWELVEQSLAALRRAAEIFDPELLVLISGQDYPCRDLARWERQFLDAGGGWACGGVRALRYRPRWGRAYGEGDDELTRYVYRWHPLPGGRWLQRSSSPAAGAARWALARLGHYLEPVLDVRTVTRGRGYHVGLRAVRTPFGPDRPCRMGSQWVALDRPALAELVRAGESDRLLRRTYARSVIPDESYVPTVLGAWREPQPGPVSYVVWESERDAPRVLTLTDLEAVAGSGAPFCRKLEAGVSDPLADALDLLAPDR